MGVPLGTPEEPKATKMEPKGAKMTPRGSQNDKKYWVLGNKMNATNGTNKKKYLDNTIPRHASRGHYWDFKTSKKNLYPEASRCLGDPPPPLANCKRWRGWA